MEIAGAKKLDLKKALAALQSSVLPDAAGQSLDSPGERELCKRAALVPAFDRELFDSVLSVGLELSEPDAEFEQLINRPGVERIPRTNSLYRFKDATRQEYLRAWHTESATKSEVPDPQAEFSRTLVDYYENRPDAQLDLLSSLILVDQARARDLFLKLYSEADRTFDLPQCQTLLRILEERLVLLGGGLLEAFNDKQQYYRARSLFAAEYYQTVSYYPRDPIRSQFETFLQHPTQWIFHLYATGGMGKTMFLRWLVARYCVVEPQRIPVARLDFDFVHLPLVSKYPWLLLEPLAAQLNEQIAGRPFYEMIEGPSGLREFSPLLRQMMRDEKKPVNVGEDEPPRDPNDPIWRDFNELRSREREEIESKLESSSAQWSEFALDRFKSALVESGVTSPIVIILDTIEEMTIAEQPALLTTLAGLAEIQKAYPRFSVVLSGRYDLRERIPDLKVLEETETQCVEIGRFTKDEAIGYLTEKRYLTNHSLLEAIYERADRGNPFKLALFADLVSSKEVAGETLTVQDVLNFPSADFSYLIERIVERVSEPEVRWVLRYGAVPRCLTRDFFERVMLPHLKREIAVPKFDRPGEKWPEKARAYEGRLIWPNQSLKDEQLAAKEIWRRLRHYASNYGWVTYADQSDSFTFHPDVRTPMRRLLREQQVYRSLQESAFSHFKKRQREDPGSWAQWTAEAVYHLSQFDEVRAVEYWEKELKSTKARRDPAARKLLAKEILRSDDTDGILLPKQVEAAALMAAAAASVVLAADSKRRADEWNDARRYFNQLAQRHPDQLVGAELLLSQTAEALSGHQGVQAIPLIEKLLLQKISGETRLSLELQLADLMAAQNRPGADGHYLAALKQINSQHSKITPAHTIRLKLAAHYAATERYSEAEGEYRQALEAELSEDERLDALFQLAELYFEHCQFEKSEKLARRGLQVRPADVTSRFRFFHLLARIELAWYDPIAALTQIESIQPSLDDRERLAMQNELRGTILGQLMNFEEAASLLEEAKRIWGELGNQLAQDRCRLRMGEMLLHGCGNLKETGEVVSTWRDLSRHEPSETELRLGLLEVTLAMRYGRRDDARAKWTSLYNADWVAKTPRRKALALSTALALKLATETEVKELLETLRRIESRPARLPAIEPFSMWRLADEATGQADPPDPPNKVSRRIRSELVRLFRWILPTRPKLRRGFIQLALPASDFYLWLNAQSLATQLLNLAESKAAEDKNDFARRAVHCARDRWEQRGKIGRVSLELSSVIHDQPRMLAGVILLEHAERLVRLGEIRDAERYLRKADSLLVTSIPSQWSARRTELISRLLAESGDLARAGEALLRAADLYERLDDSAANKRVLRVMEVQKKLYRYRDGIGPLESPPKERAIFPEEGALPTDMVETVRYPSIELPPASVEPIEEPAYTVGFELSEDGRWWVESDLPQRIGGGSPPAPLRVPIEDRLNTALSEVFQPSFSLFSSKLIDSRFYPLAQIRREMGRLMLSDREEAVIRESGRSLDLLLSVPHGEVAGLPWELARTQDDQPLIELLGSFSRTTPQTSRTRSTVLWAQAAVNLLLHQRNQVDGIFGPKSRAAVRELQRQFNLTPAEGQLDRHTIASIRKALGEQLRGERALGERLRGEGVRALVVQSKEGASLAAERGFSDGGLKVFDVYSKHRIDGISLNEIRGKGLDEALLELRPQILHLVVTLEASSRSGEISIGFGQRLSKSSGPSHFVASHINNILKKLPSRELYPLVILDVICPPGITEATRQLLLRNQFATQLFHLENTGGVIATGLTQPHERKAALFALIKCLAEGGALAEAVAAVRHVREPGNDSGSEHLDNVIGTECAALFALDPALSLIPSSPNQSTR